MTEGSSIRYNLRQLQPTWLTRVGQLGWLAPVILAAMAAARSAPPRGYVLPAVLAVLWMSGVVLRSRPLVVRVTPEAISVPLKGRTPWTDVAHVNRPGPFDDQVTVALRDGRTMGVSLPVAMAEEVARIGGVPLGDQGSAQPN